MHDLSSSTAASPVHLLVVEDRRAPRESTSRLLADHGYRVTTVGDDDLFLRILRDDPPALVIGDVRLPHRGPFDLAKALRASGTSRHIPLILVSGFDAPSSKVSALEFGADDFVAKPVDPDELIARVRIHLRHTLRYGDLLWLGLVDDLSEVLNRGGIIASLKREFALWDAGKLPPSVAFADIDNLKQINDEHGHVAGDRVLREVARAFSERIAGHDQLGRIGADEFLVVAPATSSHDREAICARLREPLPPLRHAGHAIEFPVSVGAATFEPSDTPDTLLLRAEAAMYEDRKARSAPPL